jgi:integrase
MAVYKRGNTWWFKFTRDGKRICESTRQANKRVAEQMEAARKTQLAKAEVGIRDRGSVDTLRQFVEQRFLPYVERTFTEKARTLDYYVDNANALISTPHLGKLPLDEINAEAIAHHADAERKRGLKISSVNRQLQVLRRILTLAAEWDEERRLKRLVKVKLLPGEASRERVLSAEEEHRYLNAAGSPLLKDYATVLVDCGLRPEEAFRLRREYAQDGVLVVPYGKTRNAKRRIPMPDRVKAIVKARLASSDSEWLFPNTETKSGHIEPSTIRDHHEAAVEASGVSPFVLYDLRHTCLTRWSAHMDPYTLSYLAGHSSFVTTKRYVHPQADTVLTAMKRVKNAKGGYKSGYNPKS